MNEKATHKYMRIHAHKRMNTHFRHCIMPFTLQFKNRQTRANSICVDGFGFCEKRHL